MDEVNCVIVAVWRLVDTCCLLLDLVIWTITWLLRSLWGVCSWLHGALLGLSGSSVAEYGNVALFSFLTATEAVSSGIHGALYTFDGWLQALGGVFESFKMVGHLFCHVAWRAKESLHRSVISGTCILRQTCEGICIVLSLAVYFVNTVVNILLIGTQNCLSMLATVCETVAAPVHKAVELALTLLTFLYSCLLGVSVLLWTPCQLLLDIITANTYSFIISAVVLLSGVVFLNTRLQVGRPAFFLVNTLHFAQMTVQRVLVAVQAFNRNRGDVRTNGTLNLDPSSPEASLRPSETKVLPTNETNAQKKPAVSDNTRHSRSGALTHGEIIRLLKEQEERKKCVICQDFSKTVLLLPCRHLCLCRHCADILTQRRPVQQQRCCPLCRQPITQTMEVFL